MYHLAVMNVPPYLLFCDLLTFNAVDPNRMDLFCISVAGHQRSQFTLDIILKFAL